MTIGDGQHGERKSRGQAPDHADGAAVAEIEGRRHQHQARRHEQHHHPFGARDALAQRQGLEQDDERGEAGETQGGDGNAAHLDRDEECDPMRGQQQSRAGEHGQARARHAARNGTPAGASK